jgi:hypothetical protein
MIFFKRIKTLLNYIKGNLNNNYNIDRQLILLAQLMSRQNSEIKELNDISDVEFSIYSQWGEDGIIDWLLSNLQDIPKTFVEFGVENYREANTRLLLQLKNWRGLVIDSSEKNIQDIKAQDIYWKYPLTAKKAFINIDNINKLIEDAGFFGDIGLLSIDIDGNDYWIWKAISIVNPVIVVVEYNSVLGDIHPLTVPYNADFDRSKSHYSNLYFGASLPAMINLGEEKGFTFVGTTTSGVNAFFIRNDYFMKIKKSIKFASQPSKHREARDKNGKLIFTNGIERADTISHLPLVDLKSDSLTSLGALSDKYSKFWS